MTTDAQTARSFEQPTHSETGVLTLLFTDIVSSTALKQHLGDKAGATLIQQQRALVRFRGQARSTWVAQVSTIPLETARSVSARTVGICS